MAFPPERRQPGACGGVTLLLRYVGYSGAAAFLRRSSGGPTSRSGPFRGGAGPAPSPSVRWLGALLGWRGAGARSPAGPRGPARVGELLARGALSPGRAGPRWAAGVGCRRHGRGGEGPGPRPRALRWGSELLGAVEGPCWLGAAFGRRAPPAGAERGAAPRGAVRCSPGRLSAVGIRVLLPAACSHLCGCRLPNFSTVSR